MNQKPLFITRYALARILKEFGMNLGLKEVYADTLAQVHMQINPSAERWSLFLERNCSGCLADPSTCYFLNPTEADVPEGATAATKQAAIALSIENGTLHDCPVIIPA